MAYLKATISVLLLCSLTYTVTALNIYISKEHLAEYYQNSNIDDKVKVVHSRKAHVSSSSRLTFKNGTELPPFSNTVNVVTFTWLTGKEEEVTYSIELQEDLQLKNQSGLLVAQSGLLVAPTISITDTGLVPENRSTFDISLQCTLVASGIARINVNLSLHYKDGFNNGTVFFLEKHCIADNSVSKMVTDIIQPTETVQNLKTISNSAEGSGKESIADTVNVMPPASPVITISTRQISSTSQAIDPSITSSPIMGSSVSINQSSTTTSVTVSSTTAESSSIVTSNSSVASLVLSTTQQPPVPATTLPSSVVMEGNSSVAISSLVPTVVLVPSSIVAVVSSVVASSSPNFTISQLSNVATVMSSAVTSSVIPSSSISLTSSLAVTLSSSETGLTSSPESGQTRLLEVSTTPAAVATSLQPQSVTPVVTTQLNTSSVTSLIPLSTSAVIYSTTKLMPSSSPSLMMPSNVSSVSSPVLSSHLSTTSSFSPSPESSSYSITSSAVPTFNATSSVVSPVLVTSSTIASLTMTTSSAASTTAMSSSVVSTSTSVSVPVINTPVASGITENTSIDSIPTPSVVLSSSQMITSSSSSSSSNLMPTTVVSDDGQITSTSSAVLSSVDSSSSVLQITSVTSSSIPLAVVSSSKTTSSAASTTVSVDVSVDSSVSSSSSEISTVFSSQTTPVSSIVTPTPLLETSSVAPVTVVSSDVLQTTSTFISSSSTKTLIEEISSSKTTLLPPTPVPNTSMRTSAVTSSSSSSSEAPQSTIVSIISTSTSSSEVVSSSIKSVTSLETSGVVSSIPLSSSAASQIISVFVTSSSIKTLSSETTSVSSTIEFTTLSVTSSGYSTSSSSVTVSTSKTVLVSSSAATSTPIIIPSITASRSISTHSSSTTPGTTLSPTAESNGDSETDEPSLTLIIIVAATTSALITICIMLICIIFALACRRRRKPKKRPTMENAIHIEFKSPSGSEVKLKEEEYIGPPSVWTSLRWGSIRNLSRPAQKLVQQLTVERESIEVLDTIRKGEYGWLIKGRAALETDDSRTSTPVHRLVLIKMITGLGLGTKACGSCEEVSEFLGNATLLRSIRHPNLLPVLGLNSDDHKAPIVIYPYPEIGSLHTFLTSHKGDGSDAKLKEPLTPKMLMDFCVQLSEAMTHLECFNIVHPDLQLRTCQLDSGFTLRLGDGALMSDFYPECYHVVYGAQRPVRWSALETLQGGLCTLPSNVWSFGITLWEIVTLAEFPYSDVTNRNVLAHVMLGSRLDQPHDCPNEMYELMCNCWNTSPRQRPIFADITNQLRNLARLYSSDDDIGIPTSDSAFFIKQRQWRQDTQSPPQSFHYNDQNMSHLLTAQMSASDAVSITFSALGSTEDLTQTGISASTIDDNRHRNVMSPMAIPTETDSSIHSPEESLPPTPLSPTPHINIVPATASYGLDQQPMIPSRVPLRNEPVNRFLLKADGSRESTPDCRFSMSSDSQYSSSQFSTDMSESSRQHLLRHKGDSPDKRPAHAAIAEQRHGDEQLSRKTSNPVPVIESDMLSELMASFDEQMNHSSNQ